MNPDNGNCVKKGSVILIEKPFAYMLKDEHVKIKCDNCFKDHECQQMNTCAGCDYFQYCDEKCREEAWNDHHKYECEIIKSCGHGGKTIHYEPLFMLRIMHKLQDGGHQECFSWENEGHRNFSRLMSHEEEVMQRYDMKFFRVLENNFIALKSLLTGKEALDDKLFLDVALKIKMNAIDICAYENQSTVIATGMYLGGSSIDHSCDPNCILTFRGTTLEVRSVKDIPDFTWRKISVNYIKPASCSLRTRNERREYLEEEYYFKCECERCLDDNIEKLMHSMQCPNGECKQPVFIEENVAATAVAEEISCHYCNVKITAKDVKKYHWVMDMSKKHLREIEISGDIKSLKTYESVIRMQEGNLHPLNLYFLRMTGHAFEMATLMENLELQKKYGEAVIVGYEKYLGPYDFFVGSIYVKLATVNKMLSTMGKNTLGDVSRCYDKGLKHLEISIGENHQIYVDLKRGYDAWFKGRY